MIERTLEQRIKEKLGTGKVIILLGARQTGKTTLLNKMFGDSNDILWLNGDDPEHKSQFYKASSEKLKNIIGGRKTVIIDEAQKFDDIGIALKLIVDNIKGVQVIATGSSSFELANRLNEPLTGRKWEYRIFPVSLAELSRHNGYLQERSLLKQRLIFGQYPEIINNPGNERELLNTLVDSYLYKDLLIWGNLQKADSIVKLLQALAFQVGNEVSYSELGKIIEADKKTVEKYIHLLEECFIIFRLGAFSRNLRKELSRSKKIYFYDNGVRNALISNFSPADIRQDIGALWENFMISERIKHTHYNKIYGSRYFWRTYSQQEIDYLEESDGEISAYEFKWSKLSKKKIPDTFINEYNVNKAEIITPENYDEFAGML
ncbi:MAG TPA: ATP-binding protein [Clostridiales bacterium]|nr:ATP-binding protein [Clostridiales bacterium]